MAKEIDARGLDCPQPVILTKKALETENEVVVFVDNDIAVENVKRLGTNLGCTVTVEQPETKTFRLNLSKSGAPAGDACALAVEAALAPPPPDPWSSSSGKTVWVGEATNSVIS